MGTITKRGDSYRAIIRRVGFPQQSKSFKTKLNAERWMRKVENEMDDGGFIAASKELTRTLFQKYLDEVVPHRKGSKADAIRVKRLLANAKFMRLPLSDLSRVDINRWRDDRLKEVSSSTVRREMGVISSIIGHCILEWGVKLRVNPCSETTRPEDNPHRTRRPTEQETNRILEACNFNIDIQPKNGVESTAWFVLLAQETAMRISEIGHLRWEHVNLEEHWLHLPAGINKNDKARDVPLSDYAVKLLTKLQGWGKDGRVFRNSGPVVGTYFRDIRDELGIVDLHFHDYRHEAITRLCKVYEILELCKIVGHSDTKQLLVYYNPTAKELAQKMRLAA
jgi:integrase